MNKSAAKQAILDMAKMGLNTSFFEHTIRENRKLNTEIGISNVPIKIEIKVQVVIANYMPPEVFNKPSKPKFRINPDGTISRMGSEWDNR